MLFSLDIRRARKGDCLLLHYGSNSDPHLIMIDGGPKQVYAPHLKPRLLEIKQERGLVDSAALPVDVLMVSHIDDDHIQGILDLTKELAIAADEQKPLFVKLRGLWHNSFDDIIGKSPKKLTAAVTAQFGAAALGDDPGVEGLDASAAMVLASVQQGVRLRDDAKKLKIRRNPQFGEKLIMATENGKPVDLDGGLRLTIAGPMKRELTALQKAHDAWLKKRAKDKTKAVPAAFTDTSVPNLSSIVVLAEAGGKRMLLTGDARGDKILEGLELVGLLGSGSRSSMHVDVLKVPHHGSARNLETNFFKRITADHYVFSGNGEHGNPEREAVEMLLDARGAEPFVMHFTYPLEEIDVARKADWEKEQNKERARGKPPRKDWSPAKHSLTALFEQRRLARGQSKTFVPDQAAHVIDLGEKLGF
jgi:hypothetical protein